jgi:cyclic pyranopterin phosphate synthase
VTTADGEELTHLDTEGSARMVDVGAKELSRRTAVAGCTVRLSPATARLLAAGDLPKGDARTVARIAGIQAAKRTPELLPLCHQVALTSVDVTIDVDVDRGAVAVRATARAADRTGVEMEALVACTTAALTLYDMVKAVQRDVVVTDVRLLRKDGGRSGTWVRPD